MADTEGQGTQGATSQVERTSTMASAKDSRRTAIFTKGWFWVLVMLPFWSFPLVKSLSAKYPDPPPGFDRTPEDFRLSDVDGRVVTPADLGGYLLVVRRLRLFTEERMESDFRAFREGKARVRGLGSTVVQVVLVEGGRGGQLNALLEEKHGRKPNNLFLFDKDGVVFKSLRGRSGNADASVLILDRHARLRGAYGDSIEEGNRFAQDLGKLANWIGSDPPLGEAVRK